MSNNLLEPHGSRRFSGPYRVHVPSASSECKLLVQEVKADFVKFMEDERQKREQVVKTLQDLKSKVRLNRSQCDYIIDLYSTLEVLILYPERYLADSTEDDEVNIVDEDGSKDPMSIFQERRPKIFHFLRDLKSCTSSLRALFLQLRRIMRHGARLVRECTCEDWVGGALTKVATIPQKDWGIVTPFFLHLQKLLWILDAIGGVIKELWSLSFRDLGTEYHPSFGNDFKVVTIPPPSWEIDIRRDRQWLLGKLLEYLNEPSSSEDRSEKKQLAKFIVQRLRDKALPLSDPQSSESLNVTSNICEAERFGRNQMVSLGRLGEPGASGAVFRRRWLGIKVAVKELHFEGSFAKEVEFAGLQHPHVIQILDHWIGDRATIVMELMDMDLHSFMKKNFSSCKKYPPVSLAIELMHQLAEAMRYLWDNNVAHRDLKPLNVLVRQCPCNDDDPCNDDGPCIIVKLADFGTSKSVNPDGSELFTICGTTGFMAREVRLAKRVVGQGYTTAADVYSFAITCSEILTGKDPLLQPREDVRQALRPALPDHCPFLLRAYLERCWSLEPEERPKHPSEICEFLLYCKEALLKDESSIDDKDVKVLLTHFGIKWCLTRPEIFIGKYSTMYERIMDAIHDGTWKEVNDVTESELLEAANFFGDWSGERHQYKKAIDMLQRLEGSSANAEGRSAKAEGTWRLGYCFELGLGVPQNFGTAVSLYQKVCFLYPKYASSYVDLGRCYAMGRGVDKDLKLASKYWERARECRGNLKSIDEQFNMSSSESSDNRMNARQRLDELRATKSGKRLLTLLEGYQADPTSLDGMWGLMEACVGGVFTRYNEKGEVRFFATCARLLVLFFLVSRMGLPALLQLQPTFPLLGLINDFILCSLVFAAFVSVVHAKVSEVFNLFFFYYFRTMKEFPLEKIRGNAKGGVL